MHCKNGTQEVCRLKWQKVASQLIQFDRHAERVNKKQIWESSMESFVSENFKY